MGHALANEKEKSFVVRLAGRSSMEVRTESAGVVAGTDREWFMKYQAAAAINASTMIAHSHPSPPRFGSTLISAISASNRASLRHLRGPSGLAMGA
jgi:hypothetical protein